MNIAIVLVAVVNIIGVEIFSSLFVAFVLVVVVVVPFAVVN